MHLNWTASLYIPSFEGVSPFLLRSSLLYSSVEWKKERNLKSNSDGNLVFVFIVSPYTLCHDSISYVELFRQFSSLLNKFLNLLTAFPNPFFMRFSQRICLSNDRNRVCTYSILFQFAGICWLTDSFNASNKPFNICQRSATCSA